MTDWQKWIGVVWASYLLVGAGILVISPAEWASLLATVAAWTCLCGVLFRFAANLT